MDEREAAAAYLTEHLSRQGAASYLRLGECEIAYLLGEREPWPLGFPNRYLGRLSRAFSNCTYLDLCLNQAFNQEKIPKLGITPCSHTVVNERPETGNIVREWAFQEFPQFIAGRRCLMAGAEAPLLKALLADPLYRELASHYFSPQATLFYCRIRSNGTRIGEELDGIKADLVDAIRRSEADTLFLSLGVAAKILCFEIAEMLGIKAVDWGSLLRAFCYSGSRGDTHASDYCPFVFRVPLPVYMTALESAHPDLPIETMLLRAQNQLRLELRRKKPKMGEVVADMSEQNLAYFIQDRDYYNALWRSKAGRNHRAFRAALDFEWWQTVHGLNLWGRVLAPAIQVSRTLLAVGRACTRRTYGGIQRLLYRQPTTPQAPRPDSH